MENAAVSTKSPLAIAILSGGNVAKAMGALWKSEDPKQGTWKALVHIGSASILARTADARLEEIRPWDGSPFHDVAGEVYAHDGLVFGPDPQVTLPQGWRLAPALLVTTVEQYSLHLAGKNGAVSIYKGAACIAEGRWRGAVVALSGHFDAATLWRFDDALQKALRGGAAAAVTA